MKMLSLVFHLCHFEIILSNRNEISRILNFAGKYLPPFHESFVQKLPIHFFSRTYFICQSIFKIFAAHFATN